MHLVQQNIDLVNQSKVLPMNLSSLVSGKKPDVGGTLSAIFAIKTSHYDSCFVFLMYNLPMSIVKDFPWTGSYLNLEIKKKLNYNDFYGKPYLKYFKYERNAEY